MADEIRLLGDFNNDGIVDARDVTAINRYTNVISMAETPDPVPTEDDIKAADVLHIDEVVKQDTDAVLTSYVVESTNIRIYPKLQPANWNDGDDPDGYKKYYYVNDQGEVISLANEPQAPSWAPEKYFYNDRLNHTNQLGDDPLSILVTHLP